MKNILFFLLILFTLAACLDQPDCVEEAANEVIFEFKNATNGKNRNVDFNSVFIPGTDTVLYSSESTSKTVIPLNPVSSTTTVIFDSNFGKDTVVLSYHSVTRLISTECGAETFFLDLRVQEHTFDSLKVLNRNVLPDGKANFQIFY